MVTKAEIETLKRRITEINNTIQRSKGIIEINLKELERLIGTSDLEKAKIIRDGIIEDINKRLAKLKAELNEFDEIYNKYKQLEE